MEPRIFVSSTFYDLRYVREDLGQFIESYGFKPILFERGDVGYRLNEQLDRSCFAEMRNSDMAILIVGGRYGSPISEERTKIEAEQDSFKEYTSVTCQEFRTAIKNKIPVYVFIDKDVDSQYEVYRRNRDKIEDGIDFDFPAVENINVFRFIASIRTIPYLQVETFSRIRDIEYYLKKQWASQFWQYLHERRIGGAMKDVEAPMQEMMLKLQQMENVLNRISSVVFRSEPEELAATQEDNEIEDTVSKFVRTFEFLMIQPTMEKIERYLNFFVDTLLTKGTERFLELPFSEDAADLEEFYSAFWHDDTQVTDVKLHLAFESGYLARLQKYKSQIISRLLEQSNLKIMKFF